MSEVEYKLYLDMNVEAQAAITDQQKIAYLEGKIGNLMTTANDLRLTIALREKFVRTLIYTYANIDHEWGGELRRRSYSNDTKKTV